MNKFLEANRAEILARTRARVAKRTAPRPTSDELTHGIPLFFDELVATLAGAEDRMPMIERDAAAHGERRQQMGFTVAQVVHDYGDLCQAITQLAMDQETSFGAGEFKVLNGCLDDAIAEAVTHFAQNRELTASGAEVERLGYLAHELRNHLHTASLAFEVLKTGTVAIGGSTGAVLGRSLVGLQDLVNRTLAQVRLEAGIDNHERIDLTHFLEEVEASSSILAKYHDIALTIDRPKLGLVVEADRQLLGSALSNLLQNAFKFTKAKGHVVVRTLAKGDRILIEIEDECGGRLPRAQVDGLLDGKHQYATDKTGLGLGLVISLKALTSMNGTLRARNIQNVGCVFTIDLPMITDRRAPQRELDYAS